MIFRFKLTFAEKADFKQQYDIDAEQTLYDLHHVIQRNLDYDNALNVHFFASNAKWEQERIFTLFGEDNSELMDETTIGTLVRKKTHYLLYTFDIINNRSFRLELEEVLEPNPRKKYPRLETEIGEAPPQVGTSSEIFSCIFDQALPDFDANMYASPGGTSED
ncbi:MAG: IS1096 element passenger TnpR family protein [Bacteroidales bacterium]